eukprot:9264394-Pyramimonas_sp.AAC.1
MMDLANKVEAELLNRAAVKPVPTFSSQSNPPTTPAASSRRSSARAGARWRRDWGARVRPGTAVYK